MFKNANFLRKYFPELYLTKFMLIADNSSVMRKYFLLHPLAGATKMWNIFINFPQFCHCCCHLILDSDIYIAISSNLWLKGILSWAESDGGGSTTAVAEEMNFDDLLKWQKCVSIIIILSPPPPLQRGFFVLNFSFEFMSSILDFSSPLRSACHASNFLCL